VKMKVRTRARSSRERDLFLEEVLVGEGAVREEVGARGDGDVMVSVSRLPKEEKIHTATDVLRTGSPM